MLLDGFLRKQTLTHVNVIMDVGGLGDLCARLVAVDFMYKNFTHIIFHLWVPKFSLEFVERTLPQDKQRLIIRTFDVHKKYNKTLPTRTFNFTAYNNLSQHMTKQAFHQLVNQEPEDKDMNYLPVKVDDVDITRFNLPEKYVVMPLGFTSNVREFLPEHANPVIDYMKSKGYEVVFLGNSEKTSKIEEAVQGNFRAEIDWHKGMDLINKTSLVETTKIIYGAKTILGVDNGLLHLAATHPEIPIIGGFTTVHSSARLPYRHNIKGYKYFPIDITKEKLGCINCQSRLTMTFNHSFTQCFESPQAVGNQIKCLTMLTPDLWIKELEKIL